MKFILALTTITVAVIISSVADVFLKKSELTHLSYIILGTVLYAAAAPIIAISFKAVDFSLVFFIWEAVAIVTGITLGIIFFKENLSLYKFAAFFFSFVALYFSYLASR